MAGLTALALWLAGAKARGEAVAARQAARQRHAGASSLVWAPRLAVAAGAAGPYLVVHHVVGLASLSPRLNPSAPSHTKRRKLSTISRSLLRLPGLPAGLPWECWSGSASAATAACASHAAHASLTA